MRGAGGDVLRALFHDGRRSVAQGACGVDHVVDQDDLFALNAADDVHNLADVGLLAALVHDRQAASDAGREIARTCDGAQVGRNDNVFVAVFAHALLHERGEQRRAQQMVNRDVEEALNLRCV